MLQKRMIPKMRTTAKRMLVAAVILSACPSVGSAQVVDLPSATLGRNGQVIASPAGRTVRQVQAQQLQAQQLQTQPLQTQPLQPPPLQAQPLQPQPLQPPAGFQAPGLQAPGFQAPGLQAPGLTPPPAAPELNFDPAAPIDQLAQPAPPPNTAINPQNITPRRQASAGAVRNSFSDAPTLLGDFFGGGFSNLVGSQTQTFSQHAAGNIISGNPGDSNALLAFEFGNDSVPNDIFTTGLGIDLSGDLLADTFSILEPLPPNDALTSPGIGFVFDGGTATFTQTVTNDTAQNGPFQDGEQWLITYSYTSTINGGSGGSGAIIRPVPGPGVSARRVKLSENFSPDVRDRFFFNYNFFNDAFGGLGDVSRFVLGGERILVDDLISMEVRVPTAATYASRQELNDVEDRDFEFGNVTLIGKGILLRTKRVVWSGGVGVGLPTADDTVLTSGGSKVLEIRNRSVHILPFTGLLFKKSENTFFQGYIQGDIAANGDPVFANLTGGPLPKLGDFTDSTLIHLDAAVNQVVYRNRFAPRLKQIIANAELHYTGTLQSSDSVSGGGLTYTNLAENFNIVNATVGAHFVLGNDLVVSPGMSVPLRDGLDEQFDYEALLQVNYLR